MWSWASDARVRAALVTLLVLAACAPVAGAARARSDSGRVVREIRISDQGIRIRSGGRDSLLPGSGGDEGTSVDIAGGSVRVRAGRDAASGRHDVRVVGPVVLVDGDGADMVRVFADAEVPAGQRVEGDVVAVFGSVTVKGEVSGNAVAVFGSVQLEPGASVDGDAVAIGGTLDQRPGASVSGQSVSLGFLPVSFGLPALPVLLLTVALGWLLSMIAGWLFFLLAPNRMLRVAVTTSRRTLGSLLLGLAAGPLLVVAVVLLLVTVVGIPIAILLPLLFALIGWAGQIAATYVVGCKLIRRGLGERGALAPLVAGTLFVAAFFVLGGALAAPAGVLRTIALFCFLLGVLLSTGLAVIGTGAFLLSRLGSQPADVRFQRESTPSGLAATGIPSPPAA